MKIHVLFAQRKESYPGEYGPEVLLAWDEFSVDENPDGFDEAVRETAKKNAGEMSAIRLVALEVDQHAIRELLVPKEPTVRSAIDPKETEARMGFSHAPWTEDQVASLNAYQESGVFHPFTGGKKASRGHRDADRDAAASVSRAPRSAGALRSRVPRQGRQVRRVVQPQAPAELGLLEQGGTLHDSIRHIVRSACRLEGDTIILGNPAQIVNDSPTQE